MTFEEYFFVRKKPDFGLMKKFGFQETDGIYMYKEKFRDNTFMAEVYVDKTGKVSGKVYDLDAEEEYAAFRDENRLGQFVGEIRQSYADILSDIAEKCFTEVPFVSEQANRVAGLIWEKWGEKPDYPFSDMENYGVFRNPDNRKWYMLIMNVEKSKVTKKKADKNKFADVMNVKTIPDMIPVLKKENGIYECYHMNKKNWISVIMDDTVDDERIMQLVDQSRSFTLKVKTNKSLSNGSREAKKWIIPSNPKYYDVVPELYEGNEIDWKQGRGIETGDTVYLYVGAPVSAIRCKAVVTKTDIPYDYCSDNLKITKVMMIKIQTVYNKDEITFSKMKEFGVTAVRGPRYMPEILEKEIEKQL